MSSRNLTTTAALLALMGVVACGTPRTATYPSTVGSAPAYPQSTSPSTTVIAGYGVVQGIDLVPRQSAGVGAGTIAGAVVGGVIGNQIGGGTGRTAATIAGAAGGAVAGRAMENNAQSEVYRITLRMDDGTSQTLIQETQPSLRIGDRIRLVNGVVERL